MQLVVYAAQHGMIWIGQDELGSQVTGDTAGTNAAGAWLGLMATSVADKTQLIDQADLDTAVIFGQRFAWSCQRWYQLGADSPACSRDFSR